MEERTVSEWLDELTSALEYREILGYEDSWNTLEDCYYCEKDSMASVGSNLIYSMGDTLVSSLTVPDPEILLSPEDILSVEAAPIAERVVNNLIQPGKVNLKHHAELATLNGYLNSKMILKLGYDSEFGWSPTYDYGTLEKPFGFTQTQFDKKGNRIEYMNTVPGMPWVSVVQPHDFLVPWGTGFDIDNAPWVAHRIIRETGYFKKDPKYINTQRLEPQMTMRDFMNSYSAGSKYYRNRYANTNKNTSFYNSKGEVIFNEVWEIHDRMSQKIFCVCFSHDKFLRKDKDALQDAIGGFPFVAASFIKSSRHFWTPPLAYYLGAHQAEINDIHIQATKQRRINVAKFLMLDDAMEETELQKLMSGDVGAVAKVKPRVKDIRQVFAQFPSTSNYELYNEQEVVRRNGRDAVGYSRNQMGEFDASSRRTASEAMYVQQGSMGRTSSKEDAVKHLYTETARKLLMIVSKLWTTPRPILVGREWFQFTGAQIRGKFNFKCDLQTRSNMSKAQRTMYAMQMMMQFAQFPNVDLAKMEQHIMAMVNDPSFDGTFALPQQSPQQQGQLPQGASAAGGVGSVQQERPPQSGGGVRNNSMPI